MKKAQLDVGDFQKVRFNLILCAAPCVHSGVKLSSCAGEVKLSPIDGGDTIDGSWSLSIGHIFLAKNLKIQELRQNKVKLDKIQGVNRNISELSS